MFHNKDITVLSNTIESHVEEAVKLHSTLDSHRCKRHGMAKLPFSFNYRLQSVRELVFQSYRFLFSRRLQLVEV